MELHRSKPGDDDRWRVYSYSKCQLIFLDVIPPYDAIAQAYEH